MWLRWLPTPAAWRWSSLAEASGISCSFFLEKHFHLTVCRYNVNKKMNKKLFDSLIYSGFLNLPLACWIVARVRFCCRLTESDARFGPCFHNLCGGVSKRHAATAEICCRGEGKCSVSACQCAFVRSQKLIVSLLFIAREEQLAH